LVPTIAASSEQEYPEFTNGGSLITPVSSNQTYPEFINGLPVIFVETSENTYSLPSNQVILIIFDDSNSMEGSMAKISDYLSNYQLPEEWSILVVGGPGLSQEDVLEDVLKVHDDFNDAVKKNGGPFITGPVQLNQ